MANTLCGVNRNTSPPLESLVQSGLGYCCLWAFFARNQSTSLIMARLGVSKEVVLKWKRRWRAGEVQCKCGHKCMREALERAEAISPGKLILKSV